METTCFRARSKCSLAWIRGRRCGSGDWEDKGRRGGERRGGRREGEGKWEEGKGMDSAVVGAEQTCAAHQK